MTAVFSPNCDYTLWSVYLDPFRQADSVVTAHFQKDYWGWQANFTFKISMAKRNLNELHLGCLPLDSWILPSIHNFCLYIDNYTAGQVTPFHSIYHEMIPLLQFSLHRQDILNMLVFKTEIKHLVHVNTRSPFFVYLGPPCANFLLCYLFFSIVSLSRNLTGSRIRTSGSSYQLVHVYIMGH